MSDRFASGRITHRHSNDSLSFDIRQCVLEGDFHLLAVLRDRGRSSQSHRRD